jgi:hypothetical protein
MLLSEVYDRCTWKSGLLGMQDYLDYVEVYDRCIVNPIIARPAKIWISVELQKSAVDLWRK